MGGVNRFRWKVCDWRFWLCFLLCWGVFPWNRRRKAGWFIAAL